MNTTHEARREPQQIQADIARTRSELDATLGALERRLSPGELVDRGMEYLRHSGAKEYAANLGTAVKHEPLPLALVGVGLAWLMLSGSRGGHAPAAMDEHPLDDAAHDIKDKWSQTTQAARDGAHKLGDSARHGAERVRHGAERVRHGYDYLVHEQPLALGAIGLAIGAVLAASAPHTQTEDHLMGGGADDEPERPEPPSALATATPPVM